MKIGNTTLIPQNVALPNAEKVVIFDKNGNVVLKCGLGNLAMPSVGTKRYSVGILSDTHTTTINSHFGTTFPFLSKITTFSALGSATF